MTLTHYPAILWPADAQGRVGVTVPGANVNATGATAAEAIAEAGAVLLEVLFDLAASGEPVPAPDLAQIVACETQGGQRVPLPLHLTAGHVQSDAIRAAIEAASVIFVSENREGAGVGLKKGKHDV